MALIDQIEWLREWVWDCTNRIYELEDDLDNRSISMYDRNQHGGIGHVVVANRYVLSQLLEAMQYFVYDYVNPFNCDVWYWIHLGLHNRASPVTWQTIVEAWVADDFEGRFWTIAIIDRMRQIIWNEPFDITWASRPEGG